MFDRFTVRTFGGVLQERACQGRNRVFHICIHIRNIYIYIYNIYTTYIYIYATYIYIYIRNRVFDICITERPLKG